MLRRHFALILFLGMPLLTNPAAGQADSAQSPILCDTKDQMEDAVCHNKLQGAVTRDGDTLILKLDGGKSKTCVGNYAACDGEDIDASKCLVYKLRGYFPQTQSYLVERGALRMRRLLVC